MPSVRVDALVRVTAQRHADLSDANFSGAYLEKAILGNNCGLNPEFKLNLLKRGARFEDSPGSTAELYRNFFPLLNIFSLLSRLLKKAALVE